MKLFASVMMALVAAGAFAGNEVAVEQFVRTPLGTALKQYTAATGKTVERVIGVEATIMLPAGQAAAPEESAARIVKELEKKNVGLFAIGDRRMVAAWIDPSKAPVVPVRQLAFPDFAPEASPLTPPVVTPIPPTAGDVEP